MVDRIVKWPCVGASLLPPEYSGWLSYFRMEHAEECGEPCEGHSSGYRSVQALSLGGYDGNV
jgi:hypothetical protein